MTRIAILTLLAILLAPCIAVLSQRLIDLFRERRGQKLWIFRTLMATRGNKISLEHVQALNMIDLFFRRKGKEKTIVEKWEEYLDHLNLPIKDDDPDYNVKLDSWTKKSDDLLAELLLVMGRSLGYDFNKVKIRKSIYVPRGHGDVDLEQRLIRRGLVEILYGKRGLPISPYNNVSSVSGEKEN